MRNRYLYITILSFLGFSTESCAQVVVQPPQLVVSILVDQLRSDYLESYLPIYTHDGLKRIYDEGVVCTNAAYRFTPVDRASATASLYTGSSPFYHGITATEWFNRQTLRPQHILSDKNVLTPAKLAVSTLTDELKVSTNGEARIFAFAPYSECAILSAGHAANGASWTIKDAWVTADCYTPKNQWLKDFCRQYIPDADINMSIVKAAIACIDHEGLGKDDKTDMLCLTMIAQPNIDSYLSLDNALATFIGNLTQKIPLERLLFVITGIGTREEEERISDNDRFNIPTGKFSISRTANLLNMYLGAMYGSGQFVEAIHQNQLFLNHKLITQKNINLGDILQRAQEFIQQLSGVRNVYTSQQLLASESQQVEYIRNGYYKEDGGDLLIEIAPGWELVNESTHTSSISRIGNIPFPILFYGAGIKPQRIVAPVGADQIAPTVARYIRIRAPNACKGAPLF